MERAKNKMAGETGVHSDARGLKVPNLTNHDDIGRLAQDRAEGCWKRHANLGIHLHLIDSEHLVLDRFLHGYDLAVRFIDVIETSVKRSGLAAACRTGDQQNAVR